jgi:formylglycine-generating enzyme required for sulfatase activity
LLQEYAWNQSNSKDRAWQTGNLLPNDLGAFDMLGNVYEWCQDRYESYQTGGTEAIIDDIKTVNKIDIISSRLLRGGSFKTFSANLRSAYRFGPEPVIRRGDHGLRLARTYP